MRIVVCVEQVFDPKTVKISRSREELDLREARRILSPADKLALEAALRVREAVGGEVVALAVGGPEADDAAREAVAMGADRGALVVIGDASGSKAMTAAVRAAIDRIGKVDLVLTGEPQALAGGTGIGPRLAAALGCQLILDTVRLEETSGGLSALVRQNGGGAEVFVTSPAVVAVTEGADRPRYAHPRRIANAWNEGMVETWTAEELGLDAEALAADVEPGILVLGPERERGQVLHGTPAEAAQALAGVLRGKRLV